MFLFLFQSNWHNCYVIFTYLECNQLSSFIQSFLCTGFLCKFELKLSNGLLPSWDWTAVLGLKSQTFVFPFLRTGQRNILDHGLGGSTLTCYTSTHVLRIDLNILVANTLMQCRGGFAYTQTHIFGKLHLEVDSTQINKKALMYYQSLWYVLAFYRHHWSHF